MNVERLEDLVLQALEHAIGAVKLYQAALPRARNEHLRAEWENGRQEARRRVTTLSKLCVAVGFDPDRETPNRRLVAGSHSSLLDHIGKQAENDDPFGAEIVTCETVLVSEHQLCGHVRILRACATHVAGPHAEVLQAACDDLGARSELNRTCTEGWCRELWLEALGLGGTFPPAERRQRGPAFSP